MSREPKPRAHPPGRSADVDAEPVDPESRPAYSPFDLEPDDTGTRPSEETVREGLVRGRASSTFLAVHAATFLVVFAVAAVVVTVVLLIYLLG